MGFLFFLCTRNIIIIIVLAHSKGFTTKSHCAVGNWVNTAKKRSVYIFIQLFLYNTCIPNFSYTTLYTVVCKKMTLLYFHIPIIYRSPSLPLCIPHLAFLLTNTEHILIALTYTCHIPFLENIDLSQMMQIVILIEKLHNIIRYTFHILMMWSLWYFCPNVWNYY